MSCLVLEFEDLRGAPDHTDIAFAGSLTSKATKSRCPDVDFHGMKRRFVAPFLAQILHKYLVPMESKPTQLKLHLALEQKKGALIRTLEPIAC